MYDNMYISGSEPILHEAGVNNVRKIMKVRGKITSRGYFNKRKRFSNDLIQCRKCSVWYGVEEIDHLAKYCKAILAHPIVRENEMYPKAKIARYTADFYPP
jgi:hypothetical protein